MSVCVCQLASVRSDVAQNSSQMVQKLLSSLAKQPVKSPRMEMASKKCEIPKRTLQATESGSKPPLEVYRFWLGAPRLFSAFLGFSSVDQPLIFLGCPRLSSAFLGFPRFHRLSSVFLGFPRLSSAFLGFDPPAVFFFFFFPFRGLMNSRRSQQHVHPFWSLTAVQVEEKAGQNHQTVEIAEFPALEALAFSDPSLCSPISKLSSTWTAPQPMPNYLLSPY